MQLSNKMNKSTIYYVHNKEIRIFFKLPKKILISKHVRTYQKIFIISRFKKKSSICLTSFLSKFFLYYILILL